MLIQCQSNIIPKPMGLPSCITGASIKCPSQPIMHYFGANSLQIWCQLCANPISIKCQSIANPLPIHCQSIANPTNPMLIPCHSFARLSPIHCQCNTNQLRCDVNPVPIWCHPRPMGWLSPTLGVSMNCKCDANGPIRRQSTANLRLICQSITNLLI